MSKYTFKTKVLLKDNAAVQTFAQKSEQLTRKTFAKIESISIVVHSHRSNEQSVNSARELYICAVFCIRYLLSAI